MNSVAEEIIRNTLMPGRMRHVTPNFFGLRGLGAEGGLSLSVLRKQLAVARTELANARKERAQCDQLFSNVGDFLATVATAGGAYAPTKAFCVLKWDGQVDHFSNLVKQLNSQIVLAVDSGTAAGALSQDITSQDITSQDPATGRGSTRSVMTGSGGIPTWAKALGGVVLLGGAVLVAMKLTRKK